MADAPAVTLFSINVYHLCVDSLGKMRLNGLNTRALSPERVRSWQ